MARRKTYITRRLVIRPLRLSDHSAWLAALDACLPKQNKFDFDASIATRRLPAKFRQAVKSQNRVAKKDLSYIWNIFHRHSGELLGWIDISTIRREVYNAANFGYFIFNNQRGKGFGKEAARRMVKAGFEDLTFQRLEAATDLDNKRSIALAKSVGLFDEGIKKHYLFQNNRWQDQRIFIAVPELFR
jgi:ribosomal-protein-alanine N-acetyltransferase